jgi:RNA polymerase sigma factor, sigma-70 family
MNLIAFFRLLRVYDIISKRFRGDKMNQESFSNQIFLHEQTLYRIAATLLPRLPDRQDAVQSALMLAWQSRYGLRDEAFFKPWISKILIRECYRIQRKLKPMVLMETLPEGASFERDESLHEAMMLLPEKQRITLTLYYIEGMAQDTIADVLRIPKGTVKSRLNTGRAMLSRILNEEVLL